jgi:ribosomal protein L40E
MDCSNDRVRGRKFCQKCQAANGPRAYFCKNCGNDFQVKATKKPKFIRVKIQDWKELKEGDCIRVISGSGPYYDRNGQRDPSGHSGKFIVKSIDSNGLMCYGCSKNNKGFAYIYMGKKSRSNQIPNLIRSPHKIVRSTKDR